MPGAAGYSRADDQPADEPAANGLILLAPGGDLGRRLHVHQRRRTACRAADLCLAAADHRRGRHVAVPEAGKGERLNLPREVWGSILLLALLNNALPFTLFGWGQTHIASGLASILNATTPIWGVLVAHLFTQDERMTPRKIAGVAARLRRRGDDDRARCCSPMSAPTRWPSWPASPRRSAMPLPASGRGGSGGMGVAPMSVTTGQLTAGALMMLPLALLVDQPWTQPLAAAHGVGRDRRAGRCCAPPSAMSSISG